MVVVVGLVKITVILCVPSGLRNVGNREKTASGAATRTLLVPVQSGHRLVPKMLDDVVGGRNRGRADRGIHKGRARW